MNFQIGQTVAVPERLCAKPDRCLWQHRIFQSRTVPERVVLDPRECFRERDLLQRNTALKSTDAAVTIGQRCHRIRKQYRLQIRVSRKSPLHRSHRQTIRCIRHSHRFTVSSIGNKNRLVIEQPIGKVSFPAERSGIAAVAVRRHLREII